MATSPRRRPSARGRRDHRNRNLLIYGVLALVVAIVTAVAVLASGADDGDGGTPAAGATGTSAGATGTSADAAGVGVRGRAETQALFAGLPMDGATVGPASAPVTLVEFGDLRCPACAAFAAEGLPVVVERLVRTGKAKLRLDVWSILGPDSDVAGRAAYAAAQQDRLWPFADLFYRNQGSESEPYVTDAFLTSIAAAAGLDVDRFDQDRASGAADQALRQVSDAATRHGFTGTPSFAVEGPKGVTPLTSVRTVEDLEAAVAAASG